METGDPIMFAGKVVCSHMNPARPNRLYTAGPGYKMTDRCCG